MGKDGTVDFHIQIPKYIYHKYYLIKMLNSKIHNYAFSDAEIFGEIVLEKSSTINLKEEKDIFEFQKLSLFNQLQELKRKKLSVKMNEAKNTKKNMKKEEKIIEINKDLQNLILLENNISSIFSSNNEEPMESENPDKDRQRIIGNLIDYKKNKNN